MYDFLTTLVTPLPLLIGLGLVCALCSTRPTLQPFRFWRRGLMLATFGLWLYSFPPLAYLTAGTLEWIYPPIHEVPADCQAIVVLGGGVVPPDDLQPRTELTTVSLRRCLKAADLFATKPDVLIFVAGGKRRPEWPGETEAQAMKRMLVRLGVPAEQIVEENRSRSTYENARNLYGPLKSRDIQRCVLVTSGTHLLRGTWSLQKYVTHIVPAGCDYRTAGFLWTADKLLPSADAMRTNQQVVHEWLGVLWYWWNNRF